MNTLNRFVNSIDGVQRRMVPGGVLNRAGQSLPGYVTVITIEARFQDRRIKGYIILANPKQGEFTVIETKKTSALKEAVFLNDSNARALDSDDGTNSGIVHLSSPIFSLLLPLAQRYDVKIGDMLKVAVIGYETPYTMAVSIQPGHKALGYHATGTCDVLGATIAASCMLGFSEEERYNAFTTAYISATGTLKILDDGSEPKPHNVAKAALLALAFIQLAKAGFKEHPDPLGGNRGYFRMTTGREDIELKPVVLSGTYAIQRTYAKPYAFCRYTHPPIETIIELRNEYSLAAEDMESIHIKTCSLAVSGCDYVDILGSYSAKMGIPYSIATGFLCGKAGLQEFSEAGVQDKVVLDLTRRVTVIPDEGINATFPAVQAAVVELRTTDNRTLEKRVGFPKGEPEGPLSDKEFRERYHGLMDYAGIGREASSRVFDTVYRENVSVREILELFIAGRQESADK